MKINPSTRRTFRAIDRSVLRALLVSIESGLDEDGPGHGALAVAIEGFDADGIDVAVRLLDTADVVDALAGVDAPVSWSAFGVVCEGRARSITAWRGDWPPEVDDDPEPVRFGVLVDRSGATVGGLRRPGTGFVPMPDDAAVGRIPDACRRVLGLGTPPPAVPIDDFWTLWWVERVLIAGLDQPGALSWADAVALHPGVVGPIGPLGPLGSDLAPGPDARLDAVLDAGRLDAGGISWERFRQLFAGQTSTTLHVRPTVAAWMDEGMFSRDILTSFPSLGVLLAELEPTVTAVVRHHVERTLQRWGVV